MNSHVKNCLYRLLSVVHEIIPYLLDIVDLTSYYQFELKSLIASALTDKDLIILLIFLNAYFYIRFLKKTECKKS